MASEPIPNAIGPLDLSNLWASANMYDGLAQSARFAVRILPPQPLMGMYGPAFVNDFGYLCEATEFPGRSFVNVDVRYYGPTHKLPIVSQYEDLNMTFLCRTKSFERQFFDDWMELINPTNSFDFNYRDDYAGKIQMFQLSGIDGNQNGTPNSEYMWTLHDCYPNLVNPQPVTWADDNYQRLTIGFTYYKWNRENRDPQPQSFNLVQGPVA